MQQKQFPLQNRGMRRDPSISKADAEFAFENHNIRISAREHDTALSVTNERGNKKYDSLTFAGELIGWNVLNKYIILFTHASESDFIYRVSYNGTGFTSVTIFDGLLNFSATNPIESIVDYENEDNQKIYWVDGINVLRFLNFSDKYLEDHFTAGHDWNDPEFTFKDDPTWFDSTRPSASCPTAVIEKDNGGNTRANGTAQYFLTYYNKHGQQTGIIYSSPLVYLSPIGRGGAADETNNNKITFHFAGLDSTFEYVRLYQILRTSQDGIVTAYLVAEQAIDDGTAIMIDAGTPLEDVDASSFLFLGSRELHAGTLTAKDNTLFLGDLLSVGNAGISGIKDAIDSSAFILPEGVASRRSGIDWESSIVSFRLSNDTDMTSGKNNIPYVSATGYYPYESQLDYTNSQITSFKGGEKYRFALQFIRSNGTTSNPIWIGDKVNPYYPQMTARETIRRPLAYCRVPVSVITAAKNAGFSSVQLMIAQASYSDRSVLAQGIVSPTVFNLYNRYSDSPFVQASWVFRPKGGTLPYKHFSSLLKADNPGSEMQCSWWDENSSEPSPVFFSDKTNGKLITKPFGYNEYEYIRVDVTVYAQKIVTKYWGTMTVKYYSEATESQGHYTPTSGSDIETFTFSLGGGKELYNNSKLKLISDWQKAYDDAGVPIQNRAPEATMRQICEYALTAATITSPGSGASYSNPGTAGEVVQVDFQSRDISYTYSKFSREYYFVDENIVTLNSPEIEYGRVSLDRDEGLSFRIVGAVGVTSNISDYFIEAENFKYLGDRVLSYNFSTPNISLSTEGVISWPLYLEYGYQDTSTPADGTLDTLTDYPFAFDMYMWHKNGSIPMYEEDNTFLSTLTRKRFANLHYAYYSVYNNYRQNVWSVTPGDVRQFDSVSPQIYNIKQGNQTVSYSANVDDLVVMPSDTEYPIFYSKSSTLPGSTPSLESLAASSDPVHLTYNSRQHAVISLPSDVLMPYLFDDDAFEKPHKPEGYPNVVGPFAAWKKQDYSGYKILYRLYENKNNVPTATIGAYGNFVRKEIDEQVYNTITSVVQNQQTVEDLIEAVNNINNVARGKQVFVHVTDDVDTRLVDITGLTIEDTTAVFRWKARNSSSPSHPDFCANVEVTSNIPMASVQFSIYRQSRGESPYVVYTRTVAAGGKLTFVNETPVQKMDDYRVFAVITVNYDKQYYDSVEQENKPLVPALTFPALNLYDGGASKVAKRGRVSAFFDHAAYELTTEADSDHTTDFVDIAYTPNTILTRSYTGFAYTSEYNSEYKTPVQESYALPANSFISEGDSYMFIGELYKDYDALASEDPGKDSRYGGIYDSAVEANSFIKAGPKTDLDDKEALDTYPTAVIDCSGLMSYIENHLNLSSTDFELNIGFTGLGAPEVISLPSLNTIDASSTLPTSENPTENLIIYYDSLANGWRATIDGYTNAQRQALNSACIRKEYKVVMMRYGYARRGKFRRYTNKLGWEQTSNTSRKAEYYRKLRCGSNNSLDPLRYRIIGNDLLISTKPIHATPPSTRDQSHSSTWKPAGTNHTPDYANATLVCDTETVLVLPVLPSYADMSNMARYVTSTRNSGHDNHFTNRSRDGIIDIYLGLMHKERSGWVLVSNILQIRGRNEDSTKIWEFDEENIIREIDPSE